MSKFEGPRIVTPIPGPKALGVIERHKKALMTSAIVAYPMVGDVDGNIFLDFAAGIAALPTGHCHLKVVEAHKRGQLHKGGSPAHRNPRADGEGIRYTRAERIRG